MRYDITNIPVTDVFEVKDGCPLCRLRDMLEERAVEYITGAAMMEPDIRIETNKAGFCLTHYKQMLGRHNRLGIALMLETHLDEMEKQEFAHLPKPGKPKKEEAAPTCYVCRQLDEAMDKMLTTVCRTWEAQKDFRDLMEQQTALCLPHYRALVQTGALRVSKKEQSYFYRAIADVAHKTLTELRGDVHHFTEMYDYRNSDGSGDWGNAKDSIERSIAYLTTRSPE